MNLKKNINDILFLDIETVPEKEFWEELTEETKGLFEKKTAYQRKDDITAKDYYERAGIWAEFGKIICISVAYIDQHTSNRNLRVTSFYGNNERQILRDFKALLENHFSQSKHLLCAHNGKEFDFPYIARRMIIHQIELPSKLNLFGKKTVGSTSSRHDGTMEIWRLQALHIPTAVSFHSRNSLP